MKFNCPPCSILGIVVSASALRKHMWDMGGLTLEMEILGVANWGSLCRLFYSSFSEDIPVQLCFQKISEQKHLLIIDGGHKHLFLVWTERDFPTSHFRMCDLSHYKFGYFFFFLLTVFSCRCIQFHMRLLIPRDSHRWFIFCVSR